MDSTLSVKRLFVLVQAWLCIHSWGLHFLENTPHHHPFLSEKSPQKHSLVISTLLYLLPDVFQTFPPPCVVFSKGIGLRLHKGLHEGVGSNREPDARGWGTEKGLRYSV